MNRILLLDLNNLLYRSFYALKELRNSKKLNIGGIYGYCKTLNFLIDQFSPHSIYCFNDFKSKFREEIYFDYKKNRESAPDELKIQKNYLLKYLLKIEIPVISLEGFEADDLIVEYAKKLSVENEIIIISGDKDLQFLTLNDNIKIYDPFKKKIFKKEDLFKKYFENITVDQIWLYYSIVGDAADNVPGIKGLGDKAALEIIKEYRSIDDLYENIENNNTLKSRIKKLIIENEKIAKISYLLIKPENLSEKLKINEIKKFEKRLFSKGYYLLYELELNSLIPKNYVESKNNSSKEDLSSMPWASDQFKSILYSENNKIELLNEIENSNFIAIDTETDGGDPQKNIIMGFSICTNENNAWYFPLSFNGIKVTDFNERLEILKIIFLSEKEVIMHNANFDLHVLYRYLNLYPRKIFDTMIAAHVIYGNNRKLGLKDLSRTLFNQNMNSFSSIVENGKYKFIDEVPIEKVTIYGCTDARQTLLLYNFFKKIIIEKNSKFLFYEVEMPLISILCEIENTGIYCDKTILKMQEESIENELMKSKKNICFYAETSSFNPLSTQQVSKLLFEKLNLFPQKKTEIKKHYSTRISELDFLINEHPVIADIIKFRTLSSILSKYIKGLVPYIKENKRIYTHFQQTNVSTGRLSTINPNLQNILKTKKGDNFSIRNAFCAPSNKKIISLDYSHVELRVLAHFSGDKNLLNNFKKNIDIHSKTASDLFKIKIEDINSEQRQFAKKINFGIVYGLSAFGLAKELKIENSEAKKYLDIYKETYPGVFEWIESVKKECEKVSTVKTFFGRERLIPEINDSNKNIKNYGIRMAINTIIQGTAAEIMKIGMTKVYQFLKNNQNYKNKLILQIHDEILIEADENEAEYIAIESKKIMENVVQWNVNLNVDFKISDYWN